MTRMIRTTFRLVLLGCLAALLGACATLTGTPEEIVTKRANARWEALIAKRWEDAYSYMAPSFRAVVPANRFAARFSGTVTWVSGEVRVVTCKDENSCAATVRILFRPAMRKAVGEPLETNYDETWVREDGEWWFYEKL
jgi:hypothetical protein